MVVAPRLGTVHPPTSSVVATHDSLAERHGPTTGAAELRSVTGDRRRVAADVLVIAGGAALVLSAFMHWVSRGDGSGLRGHALIDAIVAAGPQLPRPVGRAGHGALVSRARPRRRELDRDRPAGRGQHRDAWSRRSPPRSRPCLSALVMVRLVGFDHLGRGAWTAVAGALALVIGSWAVATR